MIYEPCTVFYLSVTLIFEGPDQRFNFVHLIGNSHMDSLFHSNVKKMQTVKQMHFYNVGCDLLNIKC